MIIHCYGHCTITVILQSVTSINNVHQNKRQYAVKKQLQYRFKLLVWSSG